MNTARSESEGAQPRREAEVFTDADGNQYAATSNGWRPLGSARSIGTASHPSGSADTTVRVEAAPFFEGDGQFVPPKLGRQAEGAGKLRIGKDGSLWRYDGGVYRPDGDEWLAGFVRDALGDRFRDNRLREVRSWCRANTKAKLPIQPAIDYINLKNGLLYWSEDVPRLAEHSPDVTSIIQLPVNWGPGGDCNRIVRFLGDVLPKDDADECLSFLFEWLGYLLIPDARFQRALLLVGPADSGKSTLLHLMTALLGNENVAHHSLQAITEDRFTKGDLYGKLGNICADLDARSVQHSGTFKQIVSGDPISAEKKFRDHFKYGPFTRLIFSANEAPGTSDQSDAYYKRWLVLPMRNVIRREDQDAGLLSAITETSELSGLLSYAVEGLRHLFQRGRFQVPPSMQQAADEYRRRTDTVVGFVLERCVIEQDAREKSGLLYGRYKQWCSDSSRQPLGQQRWIEHLQASFPPVTYKAKYQGYPTWVGIRVEEEGE